MTIYNEMIKTFETLFKNSSKPTFYFSPGRINLIGEHTDYNGGHVLPAAITYGTYMLISKRDDDALCFYSMNFPETGLIQASLKETAYQASDTWANYPKGMIHLLIKQGYPINSGLNILFYGNIPNGAGLSSSASIEMAIGVGLNDLFHLNIPKLSLVKFGQNVENEYIGVSSGIMDQFAVCLGQENQAILLDCDTLTYEYAPVHLKQYDIIIMNTNMARTLAGSRYNDRFTECQTALQLLQEKIDIENLCELSVAQFETYKDFIEDPIIRKRARHVVTENARTIQALEALKANDDQQFGQLINQSHISLRDDYEVTGKALDTIVEAAWQQVGVLGARMTGAGFGGCAIAFVEKEHVTSFKENVEKAYNDVMQIKPSFYTASITDGTRAVIMEEKK